VAGRVLAHGNNAKESSGGSMRNELTEELGDGADAHRLPAQGGGRHRLAGLAAAGLAAAAVAGVVLAGSAEGKTETASAKVEVAAQGAAAPKAKTTVTTGYVFQNKWQPIGTLPSDGRVAIATNHWFQTKGSQWAVVERGQREMAWQATSGIGATRAAARGPKNLAEAQGSSDASGFGPIFRTGFANSILITRSERERPSAAGTQRFGSSSCRGRIQGLPSTCPDR
jgi:hypothetical protein